MKRLALTASVALVVVAPIGVAWVRPDWVPAWARIGAQQSPGDGHEQADSHPEGGGGGRHDHGHDEDERPEGGAGAHAHGAGGHADEVTLSAKVIKQYGVRVEPASRHVLHPTFMAPARVSYNTEAMAHVGTTISGRVAELNVRVGDRVNKGDVLLVILSPGLGEAQSDYLQKVSAAQTAAPAVEIARSTYERARSLHEQTRGIALNEVQKRETDLKAAQAALQAAQSAAKAAASKLLFYGMDEEALDRLAETSQVDPHYRVLAPISGQVVEREATPGELVGPEREALLVLADVSTLWVLADVPETRIQDVAVGAKARVRAATEAGEGFEGVVSFISPSLDRATRSVQVRIEVEGGRTTVKPGMFARTEITTKARGDAAGGGVLAVPDQAVQTVEGKPSVFVPVVGEENTFAARPVALGRAVGGMVPVLAGLKEGEPVVIAGTFILKAELGKGTAEHQH